MDKQAKFFEMQLNRKRGLENVEVQNDLLEKAGFKVIFGTNACYFKNIYFERELALELALNKK